ncbi:uncharacterized protein [Macaca fascicularis]|uniref:uncharacterized protein n=1 Tax=Macaca fascicularis TaxID=9541 RepID=UPI003D154F4A
MKPGPGGVAGASILAAGRVLLALLGASGRCNPEARGESGRKGGSRGPASPETGEEAGVATPRTGEPSFLVVVFVAAAGRAIPERCAHPPRHPRQAPPLRAGSPAATTHGLVTSGVARRTSRPLARARAPLRPPVAEPVAGARPALGSGSAPAQRPATPTHTPGPHRPDGAGIPSPGSAPASAPPHGLGQPALFRVCGAYAPGLSRSQTSE